MTDDMLAALLLRRFADDIDRNVNTTAALIREQEARVRANRFDTERIRRLAAALEHRKAVPPTTPDESEIAP